MIDRGLDVVDVRLEDASLGAPREIGTLRRARRGSGGLATTAFTYSEDWLADPKSFAIDPALPLATGSHYAADGGLAGIFSDIAPDRWGRTLFDRREVQVARDAGRRPTRFDDWDYLLRVSDEMRPGALRIHSGGRFLNDDDRGIPPKARLRDLEFAADEIERGTVTRDREKHALALLLAPGSSLGGTRPKANFAEEDGTLWMAKFPSPNDARDVGGWEFVLGRLATRSGVIVPRSKSLRLASRYHTFAAQRFDRENGHRRLFASAMTLLAERDGAEASYLDIAEAVMDHGDPRALKEDLEQLFRRAAFNVTVGNRDDHLRNHAFLRSSGGWRLAPAFDLNPTPEKPEHALALDEADRRPSVDPLMETAELYRLSRDRASEVIEEVRRGAAGWKDEALMLGIDRAEVELMSGAFQV